MSIRAEIIAKLLATENVAAERAMEVALLEATGEEQTQLADVLLERNKRGGWVALIRAFHGLGEPTQTKVLSRPRDLFGPLAETMQDLDGPTRENVIAIVQRCTDVRLVYLLAEALMDARPEVRTLAGNSLLQAVRNHWTAAHTPSNERPLPDPEEAELLRRAIEVSVKHFKTHRQPAAIHAALIHERQQDSDLWLLFHDLYDDRTRAATIMLRSPTEPAMAAALLLALGSSLKPAAVAGLSAVESPAIGGALARESYRLVDPLLRDAAQGVTHMKLLVALRKDLPWNEETWLSWLRLIDNMGLQPAEKLSWLGRLLESAPENAVAWKLCVAKAIADTGLADAGILLANLVKDGSERVARFAARCLLSRRLADWRERAITALPGSPYASVRRLLTTTTRLPRPEPATSRQREREPLRTGFEKVWHEYQKMPPAVQHMQSRTVTADPVLAEQLRVKFAGTIPEIAQALKMISSLPNLVQYRQQIITLCGHSDPRVAAMAVRMIGRLEDPRLRELLEAAAHHSDPRVRANAVESMEALHIADRSQQVLAMLNSRNNRERATAIKALGKFNFATARECLARMLNDPNPLHRMSALWVVGQLNMLEIMREVSSISRRDPNQHVRRRAAEMMNTLSGTIAAHA